MHRPRFENLKLGDTISVQTWGDGIRKGTIDDLDEEGKNGRATICYTDDRGEGWWCYLDQIIHWTPKEGPQERVNR